MNDAARRARWELLGRLTEVFNDAEFLLHWLVWAALGGDSAAATAITQRLGAMDLVHLVRRLVEAGTYGGDSDGVAALMADASALIEARNSYVHALWGMTPIPDGGFVDAHQRLRDAVQTPDAPLVPFDAEALGALCVRLEGFVIALAEVCERLRPGDDGNSARVVSRSRHDGAH